VYGGRSAEGGQMYLKRVDGENEGTIIYAWLFSVSGERGSSENGAHKSCLNYSSRNSFWASRDGPKQGTMGNKTS